MELLTWRNIQTGNGTPMLQKKAGPVATDFVLYVEKPPKPKGQKGDLLLLLKEQPGNSQILEIGVICIDGRKYPEETWIDVTGKLVEL